MGGACFTRAKHFSENVAFSVQICYYYPSAAEKFSFACHQKKVLLTGSGELALEYYQTIFQNRTLGFSIDHYLGPHDCLPGISYLGTYDALPKVLSRFNPDEIVIALEADDILICKISLPAVKKTV